MLWTASFWKGATERALKTLIQTFAAVLIASAGADAIGATAGLGDVDWLTAISVAVLAAVLSLATSVGNADFTAGNDQALDLPALTQRNEEIGDQITEAAAELHRVRVDGSISAEHRPDRGTRGD